MFSSSMKAMKSLFSATIKNRIEAAKPKSPAMPNKSLFSKKPKPWTDPELLKRLLVAKELKRANNKYTPHQGKQEMARRVRNGDNWAVNSHGGVCAR